jgi:alpha-1,6-mannosyltransferase
VRVCDVTQSYNPTSGGIKTYLHQKRTYLLEHTNHEHVLVVPGPEDRVTRSARATTYQVAGVPIPGCAPYRFILRLDKLAAVLREVRPDVVELGTTYVLPAVGLWHRRRCETALTAYVETQLRAWGHRALARRARRWTTRYMRWVHQHMDATFVASRPFHRKLRRLGVTNLRWLPLGVDTEVFNPARRDRGVRRNLGVADDQLLLIFAGRLDSEKRVDILLSAFERLPDSFPGKLVLVGEGPARERIAAAAADSRRIEVLPYEASRPKLASLLASADIYVSAAPHETFGLSVIEAQACGLPVVGVRAGAMIDRVPETVGVLTDPDSAAALTRGILELSYNGYRTRGRNARQLVEHEFSWPRTFDRQLQAYEELLERRAARDQ